MSGETVKLKRVLLSTGGVGYFEYEATVEGDAALGLDIRLDQVDDVMKSIVVFDDHGTIGEISLPGREPMAELFRDLPFGPAALTSTAALLTALHGAEVSISGSRAMTGRIVAVTEETAALPDNAGTVIRHRLGLMTADGLCQAILEEVDTLQFTDSDLQGQVNAALAAMARHNAPDRRRLEIRVDGSGSRPVRVAYVIEAPLWKGTYRLTLDEAGDADAADLQGWAILENLSGQDWDDIALSVVSGNPVTFRQALYEAYYVDRPRVPVEVFGRILPTVDDGAVVLGGFGGEDSFPDAFEDDAIMPVMESAAEFGGALKERSRGLAVPAAAGPAPAPARIEAATSQDSTAQVVFEMPGPVSVANGHSVLLPVIARRLPAERVSLYQPETDPLHPLASVALQNDSPTGLPPGVLTLYDRSTAGTGTFVGDARLAPLPAGESRLISYAVDQKVRIDRDVSEDESVGAGKIVDGTLDLTIIQRKSTEYTIVGAAHEARVVVIEHPRRQGWKLTTPAKGGKSDRSVESTESHHRLRQPVAAGETVVFTATQEKSTRKRRQMSEMSLDKIAYYAASKDFSPEVRKAISQLNPLQRAHSDRTRELEQLKERLTAIVDDQDRLRQNLTSAPDGSDLQRRYLSKMESQETEIDALREKIAKTREAQSSARKAILEYVRALNV